MHSSREKTQHFDSTSESRAVGDHVPTVVLKTQTENDSFDVTSADLFDTGRDRADIPLDTFETRSPRRCTQRLAQPPRPRYASMGGASGVRMNWHPIWSTETDRATPRSKAGSVTCSTVIGAWDADHWHGVRSMKYFNLCRLGTRYGIAEGKACCCDRCWQWYWSRQFEVVCQRRCLGAGGGYQSDSGRDHR